MDAGIMFDGLVCVLKEPKDHFRGSSPRLLDRFTQRETWF